MAYLFIHPKFGCQRGYITTTNTTPARLKGISCKLCSSIIENQIEIYKSSDNQTHVEVRFDGETAWLTQAQLVALFKSSKANISEHLKAIFASEELNSKATVRKFRTVRKEGKRQVARELEHYNLDVIISVGYRVNTRRGIQFRQWATQRLKEHLVQGYTINQIARQFFS